MITRLLVLFSAVCVFALASCSSSQKETSPKQDEWGAPVIAPVPAGVPVTESDVFERHTLIELAAADNLLKMIVEDAKDPEKKVGSLKIAGCEVAPEKAEEMRKSLKSLIDKKLPIERDEYASDPVSYGRISGFETCAARCTCGLFTTVLTPLNRAELKGAREKRTYARDIQRLKAKSNRLSVDESMTCAYRQTWFCSSDLKRFLEK